jgi:hypothetical protein
VSQTTLKYKVGDAVRYGQSRGVISSIEPNDRWPYTVVSDSGDVVCCFDEHEIELVEKKVAAQPQRIIPDDDNREDYPLYDVLFGYFPAAMLMLAKWAKVGNDQHNAGEPLHWARDKSTDHTNKILRHLVDYDQKESNGFYEAVPLLWRAAALVQELYEKEGWPEGRKSMRKARD